MTQPQLFPSRFSAPDPPDVCLRKHGGNEESEAANRAVHGSKERMHLAILELVRAAGERGMTGKEIAEALGKPFNTVSGRFSELRQSGRLVPSSMVRAGSRALRVP